MGCRQDVSGRTPKGAVGHYDAFRTKSCRSLLLGCSVVCVKHMQINLAGKFPKQRGIVLHGVRR